MSDDWIILIPENPRFRPDKIRHDEAARRFSEIAPQADEITATSTDEVQFFDCGANFERACCPACGSEVPVEWLQNRMHEDFEDGFRLRQYQSPCCNGEFTLHDLVYEWPQGFGQFALQAMNPNLGKLNDEHKKQLEHILGTPLRVIYQHI